MPKRIAPIPGCDYRLQDGRVVRFIQYVFNVEQSGWLCWPHGSRRVELVLIKNRDEFVEAIED